MTWETFLVLVEMMSANWCDQLEPQYISDTCSEEIIECILDGETTEFCRKLYIMEKLN